MRTTSRKRSKSLTELVKDEPRISVCPLLTKYPQGGERSLIYAITGRKVNSSMLPADAGCIVDNVDTVISIYMAVCKSTPLMRRIVTITGDAVTDAQELQCKDWVRITQELIEAAGGFKDRAGEDHLRRPHDGYRPSFSLDIPVSKDLIPR